MGKCVSKNSTNITLAISEKDLANATIILSKISTESSHYTKKVNAIKGEKGRLLKQQHPHIQRNFRSKLKAKRRNNNKTPNDEQSGQEEEQKEEQELQAQKKQKQKLKCEQDKDQKREQKVQQEMQRQQRHLLPEYNVIASIHTTTNDPIDSIISYDYWQNSKQLIFKQKTNSIINANTNKQTLTVPKVLTDWMLTNEAIIVTNNFTHNNNNTTYYYNYNKKTKNNIADNADNDDDDHKSQSTDLGVIIQANNQNDATIMKSLLYVDKQKFANYKNTSNNEISNIPYSIPISSTSEIFINPLNRASKLSRNCNHHSNCNHTFNGNCLSNFNNDSNNNNNKIFHNYYFGMPNYLMQLHSSHRYTNRRRLQQQFQKQQQTHHRQQQTQQQQQQLKQFQSVTSTTNKLLSHSEKVNNLFRLQQKLKKLHKLLALILPTTETTTTTTMSSTIPSSLSSTDEPKSNNFTMDNLFRHSSQRLRSDDVLPKGQTESKKNSKKLLNGDVLETKGTAMSFGFRKNLNTTPKKLKKFIKNLESKNMKKQGKCNNGCEKERSNTTDNRTDSNDSNNYEVGKVESEVSTIVKQATTVNNISATIKEDDNGNSDVPFNVHFEKVNAGAYTFSTTKNPSIVEQDVNTVNSKGAMKETVLPSVINRFGYRKPVRPSSTDIIHRCQNDIYDNIKNNNWHSNKNCATSNRGILVNNLKPRSKSAHAGRITSSSNESDNETSRGSSRTANTLKNQTKTIKFNLKKNSTIAYDRRSIFEVPSLSPVVGTRAPQNIDCSVETSNNHIIRPTPRLATAAFSKFTLQTVSLPKPEYAIPISIQATTPSTPGSSYASSPVTGIITGARAKWDKCVVGVGRSDVLAINQKRSQTVMQVQHTAQVDTKAFKHIVNSTTRRTFNGNREISADSGIASLDVTFDSSNSSGTRSITSQNTSPKRSRSRPRNLQMIMNGRGKFEVRDLDESLSSESSSIVEPLALPKLPSEGQTVPLSLSGLVRSNTVLSRESYELKNAQMNIEQKSIEDKTMYRELSNNSTRVPSEENSESAEEEKLHLDRSATEKTIKERKFKDINTDSSKTSSPGSSIMLTWSNAGESLALKDFSTLSLTSTESSNKMGNLIEVESDITEKKIEAELHNDDSNILNTEIQLSTIPCPNDPVIVAKSEELDGSQNARQKEEIKRPRSVCSGIDVNKFAEMALQGSAFLLDDETSPTDSLVSSTESEDAVCKQKKHKINEELQEKDIDEISPELDMASPISPGTPTHASHSLSLSDCGNLIDDEIADQPALLFNQESRNVGDSDSIISRKEKPDTPTLIDSLNSMRQSAHSQTKSRSALHQAMELSLRTPMSLRKVVLERAESLDTLSPCESICSDDLIMDFDMTSSRDSIDRSISIKSRSGSDLNKIDDQELQSELEHKGNTIVKELNTFLRSQSKNRIEKDQSAYLPARATRLLNRSRIQQDSRSLNNDDSDKSINIESPVSARRNYTNATISTLSSTASSTQNNSGTSSLKRYRVQHKPHQYKHQNQSTLQSRFHQHSSSDDLILYDKSFRNAMIQDVLQFKKQLLRLRHILQETETLNPFENDNSELFASCGLDSKQLDDIDLASLTTSTTDDPIQELADLRRQVVYLQSQVDDRDRTIRLQKHFIDKLEADKKSSNSQNEPTKQRINMATQTERARPYSIGIESLSRSKPESISYTTLFPAVCNDLNNNDYNITSTSTSSSSNNSNSSTTTTIIHEQPIIPMGQPINGQQQQNNNKTRRHTIISTTLTNYNHQQQQQKHTIPRRASIAYEEQQPRRVDQNNAVAATMSYKPVKITLIDGPVKHSNSKESIGTNNNTNNSYLNKNNAIHNMKKRAASSNNDTNNNKKPDNLATNCMNLHSSKHCEDNKWHYNALNTLTTIKNESYQQQQPQQPKQKLQQTQQYFNHHHHNNDHNHHHQYDHYQLYRTMPHYQQQHNNLKPTVTIV